MIVVTGASGFIGSNIVAGLNSRGHKDLILVDCFPDESKDQNLESKDYAQLIDLDDFLEWFEENATNVESVYHIGACSDTTEQDKRVFDKLNLNYSKSIWNICSEHSIPLLYASSAATYGDGELGYDDGHDIVDSLRPLNLYGESKNDFDKWALEQESTPPVWYGMKFFNVYGPNESHKGRMASVAFHGFNQVQTNGEVKLFRSHKEGYEDGGQLRDFVYVKDVVDVCLHLMGEKSNPGLYNVGTGQARSFFDLACSVFRALDLDPNISFIDTPEDIRDKYQYFTEANMDKLRKAGYTKDFHTLEDGVKDYVVNYLKTNKFN